MQLLVVRHADAGDREAFARTGQPDSERPLSPKGRGQLRLVVPALHRLVPRVDSIVTSPYVRAVETAEVLRREYSAKPLVLTGTLEPDIPPKAFEKFLRSCEGEVLVCVGHEPHLSTLASWLTAGVDAGSMTLKKGGACLVTFDGEPRRGGGSLRWLFGPKEVAALGEAR